MNISRILGTHLPISQKILSGLIIRTIKYTFFWIWALEHSRLQVRFWKGLKMPENFGHLLSILAPITCEGTDNRGKWKHSSFCQNLERGEGKTETDCMCFWSIPTALNLINRDCAMWSLCSVSFLQTFEAKCLRAKNAWVLAKLEGFCF